MPHDHQSLQTAAAAMHALDEEEAQALETHAETCAECTAELIGFRETAARLGMSVAQNPPTSMRQAVLDRIVVTRQLPPQVQEEPRHSAPAPAPTQVDLEEPAGTVVSLDDRRKRTYRRNWLLAAAAAVLVVIGVGTTLLVNRSTEQANPLQQCLSAAADQRSLTAQAPSIGKPVAAVSTSCGAASITLSELPTPPAGKTYQFWVLTGDKARSVGVFEPDSKGDISNVVAQVQFGDTALGVTVEPNGGSPGPTTDPVVVVPLV